MYSSYVGCTRGGMGRDRRVPVDGIVLNDLN